MTYSEYRESFKSHEEFVLAFGRMSYEEAHALIDSEDAPSSVKASMITAWRQAREQVENAVVNNDL